MTRQTTFLASIDGKLFSLASKQSQVMLDASLKSQFVQAAFTGPLVFHVCAGKYQDGLMKRETLTG